MNDWTEKNGLEKNGSSQLTNSSEAVGIRTQLRVRRVSFSLFSSYILLNFKRLVYQERVSMSNGTSTHFDDTLTKYVHNILPYIPHVLRFKRQLKSPKQQHNITNLAHTNTLMQLSDC